MKEEYGLEEKLYVIRKFMKLSQTQFDVRIYRIIFFLLVASRAGGSIYKNFQTIFFDN